MMMIVVPWVGGLSGLISYLNHWYQFSSLSYSFLSDTLATTGHVCGLFFLFFLSPILGSPKTHQCPNCLKTFVCKSTLKRHMRSSCLAREEYICSHCGQTLNRQDNLVAHMRTFHGDGRLIRCRNGKWLKNSYTLKAAGIFFFSSVNPSTDSHLWACSSMSVCVVDSNVKLNK